MFGKQRNFRRNELMKNEIYGPHKASFLGADANLIALLTYFSSAIMNFIPILSYVSFFAPLIIYFIEKDSVFVKFHAMQSFLLNVVSSALSFLFIAVFGASLLGIGLGNSATAAASFGVAAILYIAVIALLIVIMVYNVIAMVGAFKYKEYHIPIIGNWAGNIANTN